VLLLVVAVTSTAQAQVQARQGEVSPEAALDVCVQIFDPGLGDRDPAELEKQGIFADLLRAEGRYIALRLRDTLESTGNWGAVRVVPEGEDLCDVVVGGTILVSKGHVLHLRVWANNATRRRWFRSGFRSGADPQAYAEDQEVDHGDPFQSLYNRIANRLLGCRLKLNTERALALREMSRLRFAERLAPETFGPYLAVNGRGIYRIERLPAADDPMMARIDRIKGSDNLFVDVLDQYYAVFAQQMEQPYDEWREAGYAEQQEILRAKRRARRAKTLGGFLALGALFLEVEALDAKKDNPHNYHAGAAEEALAGVAAFGAEIAIRHGIAIDQMAKSYKLGLKELAASLDKEVEPVLLEVEGQTVRLTGSKEVQFAEWREMLEEIWDAEAGPETVTDEVADWLAVAQ
jgi:hypothetical protein